MSLLEGLLNWKSHAEILSTCLIRPEIRRLICIELPELSRIIDFNDWIAREQLYKKEHEIVFGRINWLRWKDVFLHCGMRFFWSFGSFGEKWTKQMKDIRSFQCSKLNIRSSTFNIAFHIVCPSTIGGQTSRLANNDEMLVIELR